MADKRKHHRIKISQLANINKAGGVIKNISKDGMLLEADLKNPGAQVEISLKISGKWVELRGTVIWWIENPENKLKTMGIYINEAPPEYEMYVDNLYLEASEQ